MGFNTWLDSFVEEKQLDTDQIITVNGPSGENIIPLECLMDEIKQATPKEKKDIKDILVKIDFKNGDVMHFFKRFAKRIAI